MKRSVSILLCGLLAAGCILGGCAAQPGVPSGSSSSTSQNSSSSSGSDSSAASDSGASSPSAGDETYVPEELVRLEYWYEGAGPERSQLYTAAIDEFNSTAQNIQVDGVYVALDAVNEKLNVAIAAEATPALCYMGDSLQSNIFVQNVCAPLDEYFDAWSEKDQFTESFLTAIRAKDMQGRLLAIPTAGNESGIWYRKDIYAEKGIEPPTTWDNFWKAIEQGTDKASATYGFSFTGGYGSANFILRQIISYLGEEQFFAEDGTCLLRDERATDILDQYVKAYQEGYAPESCLTGTYQEMVNDFNAGVALSMVHNLGSYENQKATFQPEQYGFLPFPPSPYTGNYATILPSAKGISMFEKTCPDLRAGWEFIKFQCSEKTLSALNSSVGEIAPRKDCMAEEWATSAPHLSQMGDFLNDPDRVMVNIPTYLPDWSSINTNFAEPGFQEVLYGKTTPRAYLDEWAAQLEAAEAEYQAAKN